ncbi:hypothetical protein [Hamadaea tsunoensis]|uniref:hypothetical protein n=1 Tax=Hamadaea tsunoensis TaxID=53368 RepID=UPI0003FC1BE5|nr:hypothetical protein [Hamadaea tsunoensis]
MKIRNQGRFPEGRSFEGSADEAAQTRDDAFLDAVTAGTADPGDPLAGALIAWRSTLDTPAPGARRTVPRGRSLATIIAAALGGLVVLGGGLTAAAADAGPTSPLWSITRVVYPERADSRSAELAAQRLLDEAKTAYAERRLSDAADLLRQAEAYLPRVTDDAARDRLTGEITDLRHALS